MCIRDSYTDVLHILGCFVSGNPGRCLGVLGAAQVDCRGNINSSQVPAASLYLVGSGGGNDVASGASEVVVVAEQAPHRFVEEVPFITSPGEKVTTVISQYGLFRKDPADGILKLAAYPERPGMTEAEIIGGIKEQCGWELQLWPELAAMAPPSAAELARMRYLDPEQYSVSYTHLDVYKRQPYAISAISAFIIIMAGIGLFIYFLIPGIAEDISHFINYTSNDLLPFINEIIGRIELFESRYNIQISQNIASYFSFFVEQIPKYLQNMLSNLSSFSMSFFAGVWAVLMVVFMILYMLRCV